ncbi:glycosyltransferase [Flavobacterium sp.]|uniref:glycosyltransferase n=1 Tax=Flavobacterium sp. TaxID=239 RepID=UPI00391BB604
MKKKICLVSHTLQMGGMERVMAGYANYLAKNNKFEVTLILLLKVQKFYDIDDRVTIIEPNFEYNKKNRILYLIKIIFWLRKEIKNTRAQSVLSFGEYWNSLMLVSTSGLKISKYISDRSKPTIEWKGFNKIIREITYKNATGFIAQTKLAAKMIEEKYKITNTLVTGNPIRIIEFDDNDERENIIISVGRLIEYKQFNKLISIFSRLSNSQNWKLMILGDGPLLDDLQVQIKELNLNDKVILCGAIKNVDDYLIKSKIFAFTSYYEGFPNALAEGMMAGCSCISFDCISGPSDIIENKKNGFLIPLNDEEEFLSKLQLLVDNPSIIEDFRIQGQKSIQKYTEEIVHKKMMEFIN